MPADEKEGTEASVGKWLKKIGDAVKENEPLVEIATDKVTVEIAATANGVLGEIVKNEGDAVLPGDLLGKIRAGEVSAATTTVIPSERAARVEEPAVGSSSAEGLSPAVRRLLREHNLDAAQVSASGNRLSIADVEKHLANPTPNTREKSRLQG